MSVVDTSRPSPGLRSQRFAHWRHDWPWVAGVAVIAALAAAPVLSIALLAFAAEGDPWPHLAATVLPAALLDTALLLGGVAAVTIVIGVSTAWLVTAYDFPARRSLEWALLLPLAVPTYIIAYASVEILDYFGPIQGALRALTGWTSRHDYWFPEARSMP